MMTSKKKHPQIENASDNRLIGLLQDKTPPIRQLYLDTHRLVLETLPAVVYTTDGTDGVTGYGARQYGYDGWGMIALAAHSKWVSLMFLRGADLEDPVGLLEGSGKMMRHVKLRSAAELEQRRAALCKLIEEASKFYM